MSSITQFINNTFGGIRRKESSFIESKITCSDCQNVELFFTDLNAGVGIRTAKGNQSMNVSLPDGEELIDGFESEQDGETVFFLYAESLSEGKIYRFNGTNTLNEVVAGLTPTGKACACDYTQGFLDMFIFSNGIDIKYIYSNTDTHEKLIVEDGSNIHLKDDLGRNVSGLGIKVFDGRVWIFNGRILWYSQQGECRNFIPSGNDYTTDAGYIETVKNITAIYVYLGSLAVFHNDSSALISTDATTKFVLGEESPGGCADYNSLVFHGTDLYFYDNTKKGVFSFQQIINGDKTLGDNIALDIQEELVKIKDNNTKEIKAISVVTADRNEVWFITPLSEDKNYSIVMIYDYLRHEWVKRKCQKINSVVIFAGELYSMGKNLYKEYITDLFDGEFIGSYYNCSVFTLGSDNTLKITKMPPRITVDGNYKCDFWIKYIKNYQSYKTPKIKRIKSKQLSNVLIYDTGMRYDSGVIYVPNTVNAIVKLPSITFKALEISFYTNEVNQEFSIKAFELSKLKIKQV